MKLVSAIGTLLIATPLALGAQQATSAPPAMPPGFEVPKDMRTYYVAMYVKGPKRLAAQSEAHTAMMRDHLKYIRRMIEEKKYMFAGPMLDEGHQQGIAIVSAANLEEARRITAGDPAIVAGHMAIEMHPAMLPSLASLTVKY